MNNKSTLTWFVRGFALAVLFLLVATMVARPLLGWAQSGNGEMPNDSEQEGGTISLVDNGGSNPNWEAMVPGDASPAIPEPGGAMPAAAEYASPLIIPAADFSSDGVDPDGFSFDFAGGYVNGDGTACLKAPAYLPDGASVASVYASLYDNAPGNVMVILRRVDNVSGVSDVMASFGTAIDSTTIQQMGDDSINEPDVVYPAFAYYVTTCLNYPDHRLYSVRIYYTGP
jgi:hypothetical protein